MININEKDIQVAMTKVLADDLGDLVREILVAEYSPEISKMIGKVFKQMTKSGEIEKVIKPLLDTVLTEWLRDSDHSYDLQQSLMDELTETVCKMAAKATIKITL
jgi:hypothetical protein